MFAMVNFRVTAALVAVQIFMLSVAFPDASVLLGVAFGALAAAAVHFLGRAIRQQLAPSLTEVALAELSRLGLLSAAAAFLVLLAFYFTLTGARSGIPWGWGSLLLVALVSLVILSMRSNKVSRHQAA